ncbi:MAG: WD40 repeat domain-containing protein [bacterium]
MPSPPVRIKPLPTAKGIALSGLVLLAACPPSPTKTGPGRPVVGRAEPRPRANVHPPLLQTARRAYVPLGNLVPHDVALSPDGRLLAVGGLFARVDLFDVVAGRRLRTLGRGDELPIGISVRFTADGRQLVAVGYKLRRAVVWDVATGKQLRRIQLTRTNRGRAVNAQIRSFDVGRGGLLALGRNGRVEIWNHSTGKLQQQIHVPYGLPPQAVALGDKGETLALVTPANQLLVFRVTDGVRLAMLQLRSRPSALAFSRDGKHLAVGMTNGSLHLVQTSSYKRERSFHFTAGSSSVVAVGFQGADRRVVVTESSGVMHELNASTGASLGRAQFGGTGGIRAAAVSAQGGLAALLGGESHVLLLHEAQGKSLPWPAQAPPPPPAPRPTIRLGAPTIIALPKQTADVVSTVMTKGGREVTLGYKPTALSSYILLTRGKARYLRRWFRRVLVPAAAKGRRAIRMALSPSEKLLFTHGPTDRLQRYFHATGFPMAMMPTKATGMASLLVTPNGRTIITTLHPGDTVKLWSNTGVAQGQFQGMRNPYWAGVSQKGDLFVEIGTLDEIRVFDLATRKQLWLHHTGGYRQREVMTLYFDPTAELLYSYHQSGFLRRYGARSGKLQSRHRIPAPRGVQGCTLRPDCQVLACATADTLHLVELPSGAPIRTVALPGAGALRDFSYSADGKALLLQRGKRHLWVLRFP